MAEQTKPIAESNSFIVLDKYTQEWQVAENYQSESDLERELIQDLVNQGYEYLPALNTPEALLANVRVQLQALNGMQFTDDEWPRFVETWLTNPVTASSRRPARSRGRMSFINIWPGLSRRSAPKLNWSTLWLSRSSGWPSSTGDL